MNILKNSLVYPYTCNEQYGNEIKKLIPLTNKIFVINLSKKN